MLEQLIANTDSVLLMFSKADGGRSQSAEREPDAYVA